MWSTHLSMPKLQRATSYDIQGLNKLNLVELRDVTDYIQGLHHRGGARPADTSVSIVQKLLSRGKEGPRQQARHPQKPRAPRHAGLLPVGDGHDEDDDDADDMVPSPIQEHPIHGPEADLGLPPDLEQE